jgi:hypothetical protein
MVEVVVVGVVMIAGRKYYAIFLLLLGELQSWKMHLVADVT